MSRPIDPRLLTRVPASRRLIAMLAAMQLLGAGLTVGQALLLADVVVRVFAGHVDTRGIVQRLVLLAAVGIARAVLSGLQETATATASVRIRTQLRRAGLDAIVRLGPGWVKRQAPGRLVTATGPGLDALDGYVTRALPALVSAAVVPGVALVAIFVVDWQSGLILLVLLPLVPLFMVLIGMTTDRLVARRYVALARLAGQFLDLLRGLTTLRVYGQAERQEDSLRRSSEAYRRQTVATLRIAFLSGLVLDLLAALSVAVVAVDVGLRLDAGHVSFGVALAVLLLAPEVFAPLRAIGTQHHASQEGGTAAAAVLDIIDEASGGGATVTPANPVVSGGRVVLDDVSVLYPARTVRALEKVSITFEPGRVVALTGPSGAGKSTVLEVLLGFVPVSSGEVLLGGSVPLDSVDVDAWRRETAWLPQRPRPSQPTVRDEVRLGDPNASDEDVAAACATCHSPEQSTPLGEDGRLVSAGQRRRIALARVLVRARAIRRDGGVALVLLDEPSEDLDRETELTVAGVIDAMAGWSTVVLATHSPVLVALADERVEIAAGRVVRVEQQTRTGRDVVSGSATTPRRAGRVSAPARTGFLLRDLVRVGAAQHRLCLAAALSVAAALAGLGLAVSSMWLISRAAQHPNVQVLAIAVVGVRTFAIGRALLRYCERLVTHDAALLMLTGLRVRVFAALRPLSPDVLGDYGRGDLLRRFVGDVDGAQEGLVRAFLPACGAAAGALGAVVVAAALVPSAGLALALGLLVAGVIVPLVSFRLARGAAVSVVLAGQRDRASAGLVESLDEVVAYGGAPTAVASISAIDDELEQVVRAPARVAGFATCAAGVTASATLTVVLGLAARAVSAGALSVVHVGVLAVCVLTGFDAVSTMPSAFVAWARCRAGLQRVGDITDRRPALTEPLHAADLPSGPLGLRGDTIGLSPAAGAPLVLDGADLVVQPGSRVAIIGESGCGKSTLLTAALRLLPLVGGRLAVTGTGPPAELAHLCADDVPPVVAGSLQGDHVFDSTLRDNLRVVRPTANDTELDAVALRVGLLPMIHSLPSAWSTPAGPDGAVLSGGERQRLLLARALLADPQVLVLDEPTAHLDAATERFVIADLLDATAGRTVLMTTHRAVDAVHNVSVVRLVNGALDTVDSRVPAHN